MLGSLSDDELQEAQNDHATYTSGFASKDDIQDDHRLYDQSRYKKVAPGYMSKICVVFYGKSRVPTGRGRGAWSHNAVIFHGNAGKKLRHHAKSKAHTDAILTITSTRIDEALSGPSGIQEKTNINEVYVSKLIKIIHFLGKHNLPIKELHPALLHFLAFDFEEPITK